MDDFENKLEKDVLFTLDRIRAYERNKAIDDFANACKGNIICKTFGLREVDIEHIEKRLKESN